MSICGFTGVMCRSISLLLSWLPSNLVAMTNISPKMSNYSVKDANIIISVKL